MSKKNFTITTVATAPSPATSGTSLVVATGTGSLFALNEPAIIFPTNNQPLVSNAEIVMVTNISSDTLTITRTQEGTSAREIVAGDMIIQGITAKDWNDLMTLVNGKITAFADPNADRIVFWDDSAGAFAALTASTGLVISGTDMTVRTSSTTQTGIVELATTAETQTGTDATRAVTPDGLHDMTSLAGAGWIKDEDNMASNDDTKVPTQQSVKAYVDSTKFTWKGAWATTTAYAVNDTVQQGGSGYVCVTAHTSGTFATDLSAGKWNLLVEGLPTPNLTTSTTTNLTGIITGNGSVLASKANPSGAIVGTTDTQTLTNKTIDGNNNTLKHIIPAGSITMYGGSTAPTGYLLCDGSAVSRTTYADLFTAIGTTYGVGDGSTTFNVPNVKGKVPVGRDSGDTSFDTLGETGGVKTVTLTAAQSGLRSHRHQIRLGSPLGTSGYDDKVGRVAEGSTSDDEFRTGTAYATTSSYGSNGYGSSSLDNADATSAHNNLQPYIVFNYIIKT